MPAAVSAGVLVIIQKFPAIVKDMKKLPVRAAGSQTIYPISKIAKDLINFLFSLLCLYCNILSLYFLTIFCAE